RVPAPGNSEPRETQTRPPPRGLPLPLGAARIAPRPPCVATFRNDAYTLCNNVLRIHPLGEISDAVERPFHLTTVRTHEAAPVCPRHPGALRSGDPLGARHGRVARAHLAQRTVPYQRRRLLRARARGGLGPGCRVRAP